jgi:hypothetical protein
VRAEGPRDAGRGRAAGTQPAAPTAQPWVSLVWRRCAPPQPPTPPSTPPHPHPAPQGLYNIEGFFDPLISFFQHSVDEGFVSQGNLDNLVVSSSASDLLERLGSWKPVVRGLVLTAEQRKGAIGEDVSGHS